MKKLAFLLLSIFVFSCGGNTIEKPKHLLSENEMADIIYDINLLQAMRSSQPVLLDDNNIDSKKYIFTKYKTDSLTFAQNNTWYAANTDQYEAIMKKVSERVKKEKESFIPKKDSTKTNKIQTPITEAKRDSFRQAAADRLKRLHGIK